MMLLGELIRKRRNQMGMSQVDLAVRAGLYQRAIEIERGVTMRPNIKTLRALSSAMDLGLDVLILAADQARDAEEAARLAERVLSAEDPTIAALLWELRDLDEEARKLVLQQARMIHRWQFETVRKFEVEGE
jgi:transcriptional regulator with XRE-family HTH domain